MKIRLIGSPDLIRVKAIAGVALGRQGIRRILSTVTLPADAIGLERLYCCRTQEIQ